MGVRKYASGQSVYFVKYEIHGQPRLGPYTRGVLADMRRRAADVLARAGLGKDVSRATASSQAEADRNLY